MLRILFVWILGIWVDTYLIIPLFNLLVTYLALILISLLIKSKIKRSILLLILWFFISILYNQSFFVVLHKKVPPIDASVVEFASVTKSKPKTWEIIGEIKQIRVAAGWQKPSFPWKVKCYFSKKLQKPRLGQIFLLTDSIKSFEPPIFPFEKDWRNYFIHKGIIGSVFVHKNNSAILRPFPQKSYELYLNALQKALLRSFHYVSSDTNREVAEAMVLGETQGLSQQIYEAYTNLGAIHILSVSGMHLAILFAVIHFVLKKIQGLLPGLKTFSFVLLLLVIWLYAGITGFSAPVLRATWVFSFILIARHFHFQLHSINLLASSCFYLLLVHPFDLYNPGFQLSYLAVVGLLIFHKPLLGLFTFSRKKWWGYLFHQLWEATSVAIAAQILTLPLVIYYFYQIPNPGYFFLLNPILMILSSLALVGGFLLVAFFSVGLLINSFTFLPIIGWLVNGTFEVMHQIMLFFSNKDGSSLAFLHVSNIELVLWYVAIFLLFMWLKNRKSIVLWIFNCVMGYFLFIHLFEKPPKIEMQAYQSIVTYRKEWIGIKVRKDQMIVIGPGHLIKDRKWFAAHLSPMAANYHISDTLLVASEDLVK